MTTAAVAQSTGVGRIVWGDPNKPYEITDPATRQKKLAPDGTVQMEYGIGVAFPKADPATGVLVRTLADARRQAYPQFMAPDGNPLPGVKFATKVIDGDGHDSKGQPYATREGYAGCWVVSFKSRYAPGVFEYSGIGWVATSKVKTGDYVRVNFTTSPNNSATSPGMYVNLGMVAFDHEGAAIVSGPTAEQAFGVPPGGAVAVSPPIPATPAAPAPAAGYAAPAPPYSGYMPPPPPAPPPAGPTLTPAGVAAGGSYDAFRAAGWTDEHLRGAGYLA